MLTWVRRLLAGDQAPPRTDAWEPRMAQLTRMLDELRVTDTDCLLFGANSHRYLMRAPLSETRMSALESLYHVRLPENYRAFLRYVGDGGAGPYYGMFSFEEALPRVARENPDALAAPYSHADAFNPLSHEGIGGVEDNDEDDDGSDSFLSGCLLLSHQGCGYYDFLVVTGPTRGQVWIDGRGSDQGVAPQHCTFYDWYLNWLQRSLREIVKR